MDDYKVILDYARKNYRNMFREMEGNLKYRFIVPGSCYSNCLWDWDSWLTDIALRQFVTEDIREYEVGCVLNYLERCDARGRIPIVILPDGFMPDLSAEPETNVHKPCLAQHAAFIAQSCGVEWLRPHIARLERFLRFYYENCRHETGLYFWMDDYAIGVDNDPCTFYRPRKSSASIFLNCMMYKEIQAFCALGRELDVDVSFWSALPLLQITACARPSASTVMTSATAFITAPISIFCPLTRERSSIPARRGTGVA